VSKLRPLLPRAAATLAAGVLLLSASDARAEGTSLRADLVDASTIKLDGLPKEWSSGMVALAYAVRGKTSKSDLDARALVAYDQTSVFVAADVGDDRLRAGDHVELVVGFPGGSVHKVQLFPGEPGKSAGRAKAGGSAVGGAKVIEAPHKSGWTLEASIPWAAFPLARTLRVGLRAAVYVHDADASSAVESTVGTAPSAAFGALPAISTETEQALYDGLVREKGISGSPRYNLVADVVGDALKERVIIYDRFLIVLGPGFRGGTEYYWNDMGIDVAGGMLPHVELRDFTGDGQSEIVMRKRFGTGNKWREIYQVLSFAGGDVPNPIFQHEVGISTGDGVVSNEVKLEPDGGKLAVVVDAGSAKGLHAGNYREATERQVDPLLLPWGTIRSQTYKLAGGRFTKVSEQKQAGKAAPPAAAPASKVLEKEAGPKPPPPPSAGELLEKVHELYKKERGATGRPRFDLAADVAQDRQNERVLLQGRDVVVFGKGFKGGTGYAFLTLSQFADASDIADVTARDLTGDGKSEIVVRGVLHQSAPKEAGGGSVDREVLLIFQVQGDALRRVFAVETARGIGKKRVSSNVSFVQNGKAFDIEVGPGKAVEWNEKTYPFNQDTGPVGGVEPLILPWSGLKSGRYRWNGTAFVR
jgi:hypothetical protein